MHGWEFLDVSTNPQRFLCSDWILREGAPEDDKGTDKRNITYVLIAEYMNIYLLFYLSTKLFFRTTRGS